MKYAPNLPGKATHYGGALHLDRTICGLFRTGRMTLFVERVDCKTCRRVLRSRYRLGVYHLPA